MSEKDMYLERIKKIKTMQSKKEPNLLFSDTELIGIYQIKEDYSDLQFESIKWLEENNIQIDSDHYELVYVTKPNQQSMSYIENGNIISLLDNVYYCLL